MAEKKDPPATDWVRLKQGARPVAPEPRPEPPPVRPPRREGPPGAGRIGGFSVSQATAMVRRSDSSVAKWIAVVFLLGVLLLSILALALFLLLV